MKSIKVSKEVHKFLCVQKLKGDYKSIDEYIKYKLGVK